MNYFKFLYDVFVWITNNYSKMPLEFRNRFPETDCISARTNLSEVVISDSLLNIDFANYE